MKINHFGGRIGKKIGNVFLESEKQININNHKDAVCVCARNMAFSPLLLSVEV